MRRFFCPPEDIKQDYIYIKDREVIHHIKNVLRMNTKDKIIIFSNTGSEYEGLISDIKQKLISVRIQKTNPTPIEDNKLMLTIACAVPKKAKLDNIIDKLTQLGVYRIIPLVTEHTVVRWDKEEKENRLKRWQKIAVCAAQQSQRNIPPIIEPLQDLQDLLSDKSYDFDLKLIPTLAAESKSLKEVLLATRHKNIIAIIGPEGDFSPDEIKLAQKANFIAVSLGNLVLRVDTAALAVASFIRLYENH